MSFADGMASLICPSSSKEKYNLDDTDQAADLNSLYADWLAVGEDMKEAIDYITHGIDTSRK
ncbi:MAG: hypothetical protein Q8R30_03515 [bacterium]|nr:hypothetical protein [bacterium]MDZ4285970.1 hypothetical protein [Candidatus Sungbacteria bacterium]